MPPAMVKVLVIGEARNGSSYLRGQLESRGCNCWFAQSRAEIIALLAGHSFQLILSTMALEPNDPLLSGLTGSECTVYSSVPVEDGCWWLPLLYRGRKPVGKPALRPSEFLGELGKMVKKIQNDLEVAALPARPQLIHPLQP